MAVEDVIFGYLAKEEIYEDGIPVIREGASGDWVYVILEGQVKVKKMTPKGMVTIDTLGEGEIFGEMTLWGGSRGIRTASVIADGKVKVGVLDTEHLQRDYDSISPRLKSLIRSLITRLKETTEKAVSIAVES
ncbi:MAG: cyclic nucleotide-binding domain-containing protein [Deltaproteobacteria bacterium]|nr:cyclic nucleotide-binding domain-containing protein [Deltaproteobacteria bacterium]MBW2015881.1 cyclic nucleotide-binding domain-containing protein [Deltaproteobacteria bacterium]MBW2129635.1 cyclic nucleotide-binding domain-containing protein [Deltaproteobacteria bacterium]MBW2303942.1 cyclic nucleotide-binding domain-containing protein [Deltaproteobacteria bacterium]